MSAANDESDHMDSRDKTDAPNEQGGTHEYARDTGM